LGSRALGLNRASYRASGVGSLVLAGFARQLKTSLFAKAGGRAGLASLLLLGAAGSVQDATALNGTRTLSFHHTHSSEDLTVTFKRNGRYDEDALKQLNHFLRDWRTQGETTMDRHLFDILWEVYRDVDAKKPIQIISSYRSPATNAMLRRRSSGVARHSQHMLGHAMDFYIPDVPLEQIRFAGLRLQRGGVGFYPTSGSPFVHLDTGSIRHWPRMTHDELARVFPDGRTVHIPSDGNPLSGYQLARADIEKRGNGDEALTRPSQNLFAALFRSNKSADDDDEIGASEAEDGKAAPFLKIASAAPVPIPRAKPVIALQLASAAAPDATATKAGTAPSQDRKPQTPADIINSRGFWDEMPASPRQATAAQAAAIRAAADNARRAISVAADPQATASISPPLQALAYAPRSDSSPERQAIASSANGARNGRLAGVDPVEKKAKGQTGVAQVTRLAAAQTSDVWLRAMILAPSASGSMSATALGDSDMTLLRTHFAKPQAAIAMAFSEDPLMGLVCDRFTGSATAPLAMQSFAMRTAALR